jgi:hypothetical protein
MNAVYTGLSIFVEKIKRYLENIIEYDQIKSCLTQMAFLLVHFVCVLVMCRFNPGKVVNVLSQISQDHNVPSLLRITGDNGGDLPGQWWSSFI